MVVVVVVVANERRARLGAAELSLGLSLTSVAQAAHGWLGGSSGRSGRAALTLSRLQLDESPITTVTVLGTSALSIIEKII